jgi:hypothetical protein
MSTFEDLIPAEGSPFDSLIPRDNVGDFGTGLYKAGRDTAQAAGQVLQMIPGVPSLVTEEDVRRARAQDAPAMETAAGKTGNILGNLGIALAPAGYVMKGVTGLNRLFRAAVAGGAQGALVPTTEDESRPFNMGMGAAFGAGGQGLGELLAIAARGAKAVTPDVAAALGFAERNGGTLTRGQISGSPFTQRVERLLASAPGSGKFFTKANQANDKAATEAVVRITGGDAGDLIQRAGQGKDFVIDQPMVDAMRSVKDRVASVADVDAPNSALKAIQQYVGRDGVPNPALANLGPAARAQAIAQGVPATVGGAPGKFSVGDVLDMVGPRGDFNNYQALRSLYGQRAFKAADAADASAYEGMRDAFDEAAERSLAKQGADPDVLEQLRNAYSVEKIVQKARKVDAAGNVSYDPQIIAREVANVEKKQPGRLDRMGSVGKELRDMAAFGRVTTPAKTSGTAEGNVVAPIATGAVIGDILTNGGFNTLSTLAKMYGGPFIINSLMQGTRGGVPLLRSLPIKELGAVGSQSMIPLTLGALAGP